MKKIIITILLLFSLSATGQENLFLLIDHNNNKLAYANLIISDENENCVDIKYADTNSIISISPMYFSSKYNFLLVYGICFTQDIKGLKSTTKPLDTIIASFSDSCLMLNLKVKKIDSDVREINNFKKMPYKLKYFRIDSIRIQCTKRKNVIHTVNRIGSSGELLKISFYYDKNNFLKLCSIKEPNKLRNEYFKATEFYFENGNIIYEHSYQRIDPGIPIYNGNFHYKEPGYCEKFTVDFLRVLITEMIMRI